MARRRCKGKTVRGRACRAAPLKGRRYCRAHDPQLPAATRFGSPEQAAEAATGVERRVPRVTELLRARVEEKADAILAAYIEALAATRGVVVGSGEFAELVALPDFHTRLRAADAALDRAYGRPRQTVEHSGDNGRPLRVEHDLNIAADAELAQLAHDFLERIRVRPKE